MNRRNCGLVLIAVLTFSGLAGGVCYAKTTKGKVDVALPGVDKTGVLNAGLGASVSMNFVLNTQTGQFSATGKGNVQNLSGANHTYQDVQVLISVQGHNVNVTHDTYQVKKTGACSANAHGVVQ